MQAWVLPGFSLGWERILRAELLLHAQASSGVGMVPHIEGNCLLGSGDLFGPCSPVSARHHFLVVFMPTKGEGRLSKEELPELPDKLGKMKSQGKACFWECGRKPSASQQPGVAFSKPKLITQLEEGDEPWREESECLLGVCPETRTEFQLCPSCPVAFSGPQFLRPYVLCSQPSQVFPRSSVGKHFPLDAPDCMSEKAEDGERKASGTVPLRLQPSGTSRTLFSLSQGQPVGQVEGSIHGGMEQGMSPKEADVSNAGAAAHGSSSGTRCCSSVTRSHTHGRSLMSVPNVGVAFARRRRMCMECMSKDLARSPTLPLTRGHTQEGSHVCVVSVGAALASTQPSSDTSAPIRGRSHMCAGSVAVALARSLTSTDIGGPSLAITSCHKSCSDLSFPLPGRSLNMGLDALQRLLKGNLECLPKE
ncbi:hypothetical protein MC885_018678 [Smutsia gigantea]|nr:hypothetical protein MC885_018678 [Smutsia gigantea]